MSRGGLATTTLLVSLSSSPPLPSTPPCPARSSTPRLSTSWTTPAPCMAWSRAIPPVRIARASFSPFTSAASPFGAAFGHRAGVGVEKCRGI
eukprot:6444532-Prymnesium_polylepis.1